MGRTDPVMPFEASDAKKCAAFATSVSVASLFRAVSDFKLAIASSTVGPPSAWRCVTLAIRASVRIGPGARAFTRISIGPKSSAAARVMPIAACFEAVYNTCAACAVKPLIDAITTMEAWSEILSLSAQAPMLAAMPHVLIAITCIHSSPSISRKPRQGGTTPAFAINRSTDPRSSASVTSCSLAFVLDRSQPKKTN